MKDLSKSAGLARSCGFRNRRDAGNKTSLRCAACNGMDSVQLPLDDLRAYTSSPCTDHRPIWRERAYNCRRCCISIERCRWRGIGIGQETVERMFYTGLMLRTFVWKEITTSDLATGKGAAAYLLRIVLVRVKNVSIKCASPEEAGTALLVRSKA